MTHVVSAKDQKLATRRGVTLYENSPFLPNIKLKTKRVTNKRGNMMLVNCESGEVAAPIAGFWEAEEVDSTKFVKLFVNGVKALAELSNAGTRVFELLYTEIQKNIGKDQVWLSYTGLTEDSISRSTLARGLAELIDKKFIAAQPAMGWYWVNPDFIWNGDRLAFYKEYRRVTSVSRKAIKQDSQTQDNQTVDMFKDSSPLEAPALE